MSNNLDKLIDEFGPRTDLLEASLERCATKDAEPKESPMPKEYGSQLTQFWHAILEKLGLSRDAWPFIHEFGLWLVAIAAVILTVGGAFIYAALRR